MDILTLNNLNPSSFLPSLSRISQLHTSTISEAIHRLQDIYSPFSRASYDISKEPFASETQHSSVTTPDSGYASEDEDVDCDGGEEAANQRLEILRADSFERAHVVRWLTSFIGKAYIWTSGSADEKETMIRESIVDEAATLLAQCAHVEESDAEIARHFEFKTSFPAKESKIEVELNDAPLSSNDHTSVGLQSWGSSVVLAKMLCANPEEFGLCSQDCIGSHRRILELGAGTGLLTIVTAKILSKIHSGEGFEIVATDFHPDVLHNLRHNIAENLASLSQNSNLSVCVEKYDWKYPRVTQPFDEAYDIILAADVVYHLDHAGWIKNCVEKLLKRPSTESPQSGVFWLLIAVRRSGRHDNVDNTVEEAFRVTQENTGCGAGSSQLRVLSSERITRTDKVGRADEGEYRLFKIAWA